MSCVNVETRKKILPNVSQTLYQVKTIVSSTSQPLPWTLHWPLVGREWPGWLLSQRCVLIFSEARPGQHLRHPRFHCAHRCVCQCPHPREIHQGIVKVIQSGIVKVIQSEIVKVINLGFVKIILWYFVRLQVKLILFTFWLLLINTWAERFRDSDPLAQASSALAAELDTDRQSCPEVHVCNSVSVHSQRNWVTAVMSLMSHSPEPHLITWPSSDLPLTLKRPLPNLD